MKKMIVGMAALIIAGASFAQPGRADYKNGRQHEMHQRGGGKQLEKLNLSDAQKAQMKAVNEDFRKQMQDLDRKESITVKEQRDQKEAIRKAHKAKIESLLTPEQKTQLAQLKADAEKRRAEMAEKHLADMKEKLGLSDAQVATLKSKQQATTQKRHAILKNESLDGTQKREQLTAIRQEMRTNMESVLTPEQKQKMEELRRNRQEKNKFSEGHRGQGYNSK